jgi:2-hydroxycyclohexanecarboxyl-CoA dehydrogenase
MELAFRDRVVVVTGAAGGIGRVIAQLFARAGARVAACDIAVSGIEETASLITAAGDAALPVQLDVTDRTAVGTAFGTIEARLGPVQVLVNNAALISRIAPFVELDPELAERDIRVALFGTMNCTRRVVPGMVQRGEGRIVNVASDAGRAGNGRLASYSAGKGGVIAFTKAMAQELGEHGITVNAISPGSVRAPMRDQVLQDIQGRMGQGGVEERERKRTEQIPMRRVAEPEDVAHAVLFFASQLAADITGQTLSVNGGFRMY